MLSPEGLANNPPAGSAAKAPSPFLMDDAAFEKQTAAIFKRIDTNKDGRLDREEVAVAMRELGVPTGSALDSWFEKNDRDSSGTVTYDEFRSFRTKRRRLVQEVWHEVRHSEEHITYAAMVAGLKKLGMKATDEEIRTKLASIDTSGDGRVSFAEFAEWLVLLPDVNPRAVFDEFARVAVVEDAQGEYTVVQEQPAGLAGAAVVAKLFSGGVAGMVSRTCTAPVDRMKVILQAGKPGVPPPGMGEVVRQVLAEGKGFRAFFRGNGANCVKVAPETGVKFVAFDVYSKMLAQDPSNVTVAERFVAGGLAGATGQTAIYPLEIAKTRLALCKPGRYRGLGHCLSSVRADEGIRALYSGLGTSVVGIIPYAAIDLACNSILKEIVSQRLDAEGAEPSVPVLLGCGISSSTAAMLATYPINIVRTRLQIAGMEEGAVVPKPWEVVRETMKADGMRGFYRGLLPNMIKVLPATGISYTMFSVVSERVNRLLPPRRDAISR